MKIQVPCSGCKKECLSELIGTYALVFLGPGSVVVASIIPNLQGFLRTVFIASVFGGTVGIVILFLGNFGAVINPAITFGASFGKVLSSKFFIPFLFFQILGGLLAGFTLKIVFGSVGQSVKLRIYPSRARRQSRLWDNARSYRDVYFDVFCSNRFHAAQEELAKGVASGIDPVLPDSLGRPSHRSWL